MAKSGARLSDSTAFPNSFKLKEVPLWPLSEIKGRHFVKIYDEWKFRWNHNAELSDAKSLNFSD